MKLRLKEIKYIGHIISEKGIKPDPKKIESILNMPAPTNINQLKRFTVMRSYLSKFLPNISSITEPMRSLEKKGQLWHWGQHQ